MFDPKLELAYKAAEAQLKGQNDTLASFRNRATTLFTLAALVTSFSTSIGLINTAGGEKLPTWTPWVLLGFLTAVGFASMKVLWPIQAWHYCISATQILDLHRLGVGEDQTLKEVVDDGVRRTQENEQELGKRAWWFRVGVTLFFVEISVLVIAVGTH
ncbi:hypothetical protein [Streptomyces sp. NPDC048637]|uniref:hypothetical protein n=1 Tax=Streptomyces TaxID=1883 RepID=UPI00342C1263